MSDCGIYSTFPFLSVQLRTDAEKRSLVESGLSWYSEDAKAVHKLSSSSYDTGSLKTEAPSKWRKKPPSFSEDAGNKSDVKKPQSLGQPVAFKKGRNPPVGVTSPITHTSQSVLKVAGKTYGTLTLNVFLVGFVSIFVHFNIFTQTKNNHIDNIVDYTVNIFISIPLWLWTVFCLQMWLCDALMITSHINTYWVPDPVFEKKIF